MTQIPDAAVQAFMAEFHQRTGVSYEANIRASLEKTLPHLPLGLEVKKLEWSEHSEPNEECSYDHIFSETSIGKYQIEWKSWKYYDAYVVYLSDGFISSEYDLTSAKAAAQADFESRVRECHVPRPDVKTMIEEIRNGTRQGFLNEGDQPELTDTELSCPYCSGSGHIDDVVTKSVDVSALHILETLKKAEMFIENGVELGFIRLPDQGDPALETLPLIKEAIRVISDEPAQGEP